MSVIPINGNDGHFSKTESNAVAGYMSVLTTLDYNPAEHGMTAKPKDDSQPPAAYRRQRAYSMSGITPNKIHQQLNRTLVKAKIKSYLCKKQTAREWDNGKISKMKLRKIAKK